MQRKRNRNSKRLDATTKVCPLLAAHTIYGPYMGVDGRMRVHVYDPDGIRFSLLYSKFLWVNANNKWPNADEDIDHIDGDKTNDTLNNLRCISNIANNSKKSDNRPTTYVKLICLVCDKIFVLPITATHLYPARKRKHNVTTCNASCKRTFLNYANRYPSIPLKSTILETFTATKAESDKWHVHP